MTRRLVSASTIEELQVAGRSELRLAPGDVITPLARDRAQELGLDLVVSTALGERTAREPALADPTPTDVRAAVIAALGYEPADLDQVIAKVWQG
ncbi:MAG: hypothetical protein Q4D79_01675 [Propionibacteriaceae bacterium]|nr:hypothetical protein [Propionibacteriaceae bacterium]